MMKAACLVFCLSVGSVAFGAEQTDACAGLDGSALSQCRSYQQTLRLQQDLQQQLQEQRERQNQLDKQQREVQQQLESMRQQNESLRKQLERQASQPARPIATEFSKNADLKSWRAANPWFGTDYARTQFATGYIKQLQQERPDLTGRELLDALSDKVNQTFGARR